MSGLTKFFYSTMEGAPVLNASWGSLLNMFRTIATGEFNAQIASTVTISDNLATINFDTPHNFIRYQVVKLSGANEPQFNKEFRVYSTSPTSIVIKCEDTDTIVTGTITVSTAGLGWTETHTGDNKAVFRAKDDIENPFYLRIDDSCPVGYTTTWGKFARVTISSGIDSIDDYGVHYKAPQNSEHVNTNERGDGVTGANGIYGWAKWYHGLGPGTNYYYENVKSISDTIPLGWEIVGDDSGIYLYVDYTNSPGRLLYAFTAINKLNPLDKFNCYLSAVECLNKASDRLPYTSSSSGIYRGVSQDSGATDGKFILRDYLGAGVSHTSPSIYSLAFSSISGHTSTLPFPNRVDNSIILHDIYVRDGGFGIRGTLPIIKWVHHRWSNGNYNILDNGSEVYIVIEGSRGNPGYSHSEGNYAYAYELVGW